MFAGRRGRAGGKHYRFAHDQQLNTGYSIADDIFSAKLKELSKGTMLVDQYPGAQLGQEPQLLQLVKSGDIDFCIISSANTATHLAAGRRDVAALPVPLRRHLSRRSPTRRCSRRSRT